MQLRVRGFRIAPWLTNSRAPSSPLETSYFDLGLLLRYRKEEELKFSLHKHLSNVEEPPFGLSFGFAPIASRYLIASVEARR